MGWSDAYLLNALTLRFGFGSRHPLAGPFRNWWRQRDLYDALLDVKRDNFVEDVRPGDSVRLILHVDADGVAAQLECSYERVEHTHGPINCLEREMNVQVVALASW